MIPATIPPAAAPAPATPPRAGARDRKAPGFDDALRAQESGSAEPAKGESDPLAVADQKPAPDDAVPVTAPPPPPPVALDTLISQVLPQQQTMQMSEPPKPAAPTEDLPRDPALERSRLAGASLPARRAGAVDAQKLAANESASDVTAEIDLDSPASDGAKSQRPVAQENPGQLFREQTNDPEPQGGPGRGASAFTPATSASAHGETMRGHRASEDDGSGSQLRDVAVRKVATATHFPVTTDPVRQIATAVTRALDAPAAPSSPADASAQPIKTVSVQLEPESLGTVTLRMRLSGSQLSVRVDVAEPATLEMIQRDRDRLQKSMASGSVSVDRLEILPANRAAPVQGGDNANAPKQDMNAPGQQSRQNGASHNGANQQGEQRGGARQPQQPASIRSNGQEYDSPRGSDSRGLYL